VTDKDFRGKFMLIYFGFTMCPDICPAELEKMKLALDAVAMAKHVGNRITPVFISIDPKRDTKEKVEAFKKDYHADTVWLTGTDEQLLATAKKFRVYYSKPNTDDGNVLLVMNVCVCVV
jgi:protein SCO1/2